MKPGVKLRAIPGLGTAATALAAYALVARPWSLRWGTTDEEVTRRLPGDEYKAETVLIPIEQVMLEERTMPREYIADNGHDVTQAFVDWCRPLLGEPIRVTEVAPGLVETEFSLVRFKGDAERAKSVYRGLDPLTPEDIADCVVWAATRPSHVNIDEIVVRPRDQATATQVHRRP